MVVAFGGQTAIKLTKTLAENKIPILGSSADTIDMAEDRERFDALLERSGIKRPKGHTIMTTEEALPQPVNWATPFSCVLPMCWADRI